MKKSILNFHEIAERAGYVPGADGKLNLPATQLCADTLAIAAVGMLSEWKPGDDRHHVVLTGPGPVWAYLVIAHALHGRVVMLEYAAPNAEITIFRHGV